MTKVIKNRTHSLLDKFSQTEEEFLKQHAPEEDVLQVLPPSIVTNNRLREIELENKSSQLAIEERNIEQLKQKLTQELQAVESKAVELAENEKMINANMELLTSIEKALQQKEQELALKHEVTEARSSELVTLENVISKKEDLLLTVAQQLLIKEEQLNKTKIPLPKIFERFSNHAQARITTDQILIVNDFDLPYDQLKRINLCLSMAVEFAAVNLDSRIELVSIEFESPTRFRVDIDVKKTWSYILKVSPTGDFLLQKFNRAVKSWNVEYNLLSKEQSKNHIHGYQFNFNFDHAISTHSTKKSSKSKSHRNFIIDKTSQYDV